MLFFSGNFVVWGRDHCSGTWVEFFSKSTLEISGSTPQSQNELVFWDSGAHLRVVFKIERLTYMLGTMSDQCGVKLPFVEISQCCVTSYILPWKYLSTAVSKTTTETAKKQYSPALFYD